MKQVAAAIAASVSRFRMGRILVTCRQFRRPESQLASRTGAATRAEVTRRYRGPKKSFPPTLPPAVRSKLT